MDSIFKIKAYEPNRKAMWAAIYIAAAFVGGGGLMELVCVATLFQSSNLPEATAAHSSAGGAALASVTRHTPRRHNPQREEQPAPSTGEASAILSIDQQAGLSH